MSAGRPVPDQDEVESRSRSSGRLEPTGAPASEATSGSCEGASRPPPPRGTDVRTAPTPTSLFRKSGARPGLPHPLRNLGAGCGLHARRVPASTLRPAAALALACLPGVLRLRRLRVGACDRGRKREGERRRSAGENARDGLHVLLCPGSLRREPPGLLVAGATSSLRRQVDEAGGMPRAPSESCVRPSTPPAVTRVQRHPVIAAATSGQPLWRTDAIESAAASFAEREVVLHFDPVCEMVVNPRRATTTLERAGRRTYFCSTNCRERRSRCTRRSPSAAREPSRADADRSLRDGIGHDRGVSATNAQTAAAAIVAIAPANDGMRASWPTRTRPSPA